MGSVSGPRKWESKAALLEHIGSFEGRALMLGSNAEAPREFYSFSVSCEGGAREIGVLASGHGTKPEVALLAHPGSVIVGHDTWLTWLNLSELAVIATRQLNGVFYRFQPLADSSDVLAIHELGVVRVDAYGTELWAVHTDVIEQADLDSEGTLAITQMDAPSALRLSVHTGQVLNTH